MRKREVTKKSSKKRMLEKNDRIAVISPGYRSSGKLAGKVAIITGGDSGIGRSVAVHYAREGASVAIVYHQSDDDAMETKRLVEDEHQQCLVFKGDIAGEAFCRRVVR